ncbi:UDP-3-O-[3-hydroxymyristoyl] N-acetylglucosamine deacetylase [Anatilimnocola aggregata]|uniref:UDP-3-O-acyl-N-acetylglucosamine deacetylase n=1 Tax=Anatilimnocola aggregata TaxID=2528021 RepID=A0A517Y8B3_9BACT|nr:UDP-3-O-acyl-N-acetylglucosamine deacetylase [Anatilimnocola aggregata]QDU26477.1 UDP-3-O-[3-hydroxymyristoyl] N-acetylglucosamine deacetylase [Anatilimnocola aggregata]
MAQLRKQQTLAQVAEFSGFGYWSGKDVRVELRPAPVDSGLQFVRSDIAPHVRIAADARNRLEAPRRTTLATGTAQVEMVEHILAALYGLQIDNCEVWVDQAEMPGGDGSSLAIVEAIEAAGIAQQEAPAKRLVISEVVRVGDDESWVEARPHKHGGLSVRYRLDYGPECPIGRETIDLKVTPKSFRNELASARTFLLEEEADWLRSRGLGTRVTNQDLLVFGKTGLIDNTLRFENECVRHKALDLVGDLALAGCELVGHVIAHRSGHRLNAELVRTILQEGRVEGGLRRTG